jgi:hypothetical protein
VVHSAAEAANLSCPYQRQHRCKANLSARLATCNCLTYKTSCCLCSICYYISVFLAAAAAAAAGQCVRGLDVGCGANFIYCLLGAALYGWHMTGVDVTEVTHAQHDAAGYLTSRH